MKRTPRFFDGTGLFGNGLSTMDELHYVFNRNSRRDVVIELQELYDCFDGLNASVSAMQVVPDRRTGWTDRKPDGRAA